jgi:hypothetical protein
MMEKIVQTAKQTVKATVEKPSARREACCGMVDMGCSDGWR